MGNSSSTGKVIASFLMGVIFVFLIASIAMFVFNKRCGSNKSVKYCINNGKPVCIDDSRPLTDYINQCGMLPVNPPGPVPTPTPEPQPTPPPNSESFSYEPYQSSEEETESYAMEPPFEQGEHRKAGNNKEFLGDLTNLQIYHCGYVHNSKGCCGSANCSNSDSNAPKYD